MRSGILVQLYLGVVDFCCQSRDVSAYYGNGKTGLRNLSLKIKRGEHIGVVGSSGSGKSSLGKALLGVLPISEGSYSIAGISFNEIASGERASKISCVLPDFDSYPQHSNQITPQVTDFTKHDFSLR